MSPRRYTNVKTISLKLADLTLQRLKLEDEIKRIKALEADLVAQGMKRFEATATSQVALPEVGDVKLVTEPVATVEDWDKVFAYAAAHPEAGVVHKRVSPTQVEKLSFDGEVVPGVVLSHHKVLRVNVRKARQAQKAGNR